MEYGININLTYDELKALYKSVSIGCEQLLKKLERLEGTKYADDAAKELHELMFVHNKVSNAYSTMVQELAPISEA